MVFEHQGKRPGIDKTRMSDSIMPEMTRRYEKALGSHIADHPLD